MAITFTHSPCWLVQLPSTDFLQKIISIQKWKQYAEAKAPLEIPEIFRGYHFTGPLRPGKVSPFRSIKPAMDVPDYAVNGVFILYSFGVKQDIYHLIKRYTCE